jgi:transketolase
MPTEPILDKWASFGWHVQEIDGHNVSEILDALDRSDEVHAKPSIIIARTTKGKGACLFEYDHRWHGAPPNEAQYKQVLAELEEGLARWEK